MKDKQKDRSLQKNGGGMGPWLVGARLHTLSAAVVPVLVGGALAWGAGVFAWWVFGLTLLGAVLVQVGANFTDEYADHETTASSGKYPAPHKVIARGLLTKGQVKTGAVVVFLVATVIGIVLVAHTGWPLLVLCLASLAGAWFYSAGPYPLGDYALGEPLVFVLMGPVMVGGTYYVQALELTPAVWLWSLPVGALVSAILVANNLRDFEEDKANNRLTLAILFGVAGTRWGYRLLLLVGFCVPLAAYVYGLGTIWWPFLTLPLGMWLMWQVGANERDALHRVLKGTSALHLLYGVLLTLDLVL